MSIFILSFVLPARESKQDLTSYASICSKYCSFPCACCLHRSHLHSNLGKCLLSRTWTEETVSATGRSSRRQQRLSMPSPSQETHGETSYFKPDPPDVEQCSFLMAGTHYSLIAQVSLSFSAALGEAFRVLASSFICRPCSSTQPSLGGSGWGKSVFILVKYRCSPLSPSLDASCRVNISRGDWVQLISIKVIGYI